MLSEKSHELIVKIQKKKKASDSGEKALFLQKMWYNIVEFYTRKGVFFLNAG